MAVALGIAGAQEAQPQGSTDGMMGMMQECRMPTYDRHDSELRKSVDEARQSNDPAKMRAALDQVHKSLNTMDQHMSQCMRSMGDMDSMGDTEKMHGKMGGMMQRGPEGRQSESKKGSPKP